MKPILVTGATGFLGGAVVRDLQARGREVRATGRDRALGEELQAQGIAFTACDLADSPEAVLDLMEGCGSVVHCAALASPWGVPAHFQAANVRATRHLVAACERHGIERLVHISSPSVVFAFADQLALSEGAPWTAPPANDYIASKREAERLVLDAHRQSGLPVIVLRPQAIFGAGDPTLLPRILRVARRGFFPRFRTAPTLLDLVWIGDAVQAVRRALDAPAALHGRVYSITSGDPQPFSAILKAACRSQNLAVQTLPLPFPLAFGFAAFLEGASRLLTGRRWEPPLTRYSVGALTFSRTFDIAAARRDLGYEPGGAVLERLAALAP